ncbi:hypothetical protein E3C22_15255 [Jiella endophytica]|uniref:Toxin-activating lysine-acyltransferase n=1 Tax=Jiella endophytica TaxID=2558362 RepID=A0A4Y8RJ78_9HYPH|nr:hypothetical protein [Jiella endophytica]TFF22004.1 hypothetical protein E3C22_15255 [Jiella endophytica]
MSCCRPAVDVNRHAAVGRALAYCMTDDVFGQMPLRAIARLIIGQVNRSQYFFLMEDGVVHGYCGWMRCTAADGEAWVTGRQPEPHPVPDGEACIVNMWKSSGPEVNAAISRELRRRLADATHLYARRFYADGRIRPVRITAPRFAATPSSERAM